jgi:single-strand DNA-binding protein
MKGLNKVQLIGNVGGEPESKYTDHGTARTTFSVAVNRQWTDAEGQHQQETEWIPVITWGKLAEVAGEYITKGKRVYIEGRLHTHSWTAEETGEKRSRIEVIAHDLILLGTRPDQADDLEAEADTSPARTPRQHMSSAATQHESTPSPQQTRHRRRPPAATTSSGDIDWEAGG